MIGLNTTAVFAAGIISGRIGGLYEQISASNFWLIHAAIVGTGCVLITVFGAPIRKLLRGEADEAST
jgi:POT family proton-dependent oligopeptide transporter